MCAGNPQIYHSTCESDTSAIAHAVGVALVGGEYISLEGDLGAGKTFFARELARSLGITQSITSPTFVLQKVYPVSSLRAGISTLAHYDFYRIGNYHDLLDLGFEDHDPQTIVVAEWGNLFIDDFPVTPVRIQFESNPNNTRLISISGLILLS